MTVFMILFNLKEASFSEQISKPELFISAVAYIVIGIFALGYFTWKSKNKRESKQ
jgi:hypothetical protein